MSIVRTFRQTHRHYRDEVNNVIDVDGARAFGYPLVADCGRVWIPGEAEETKDLPICPDCEAANAPREFVSREDRPHYVYRCYDGNDRLIYVGCSGMPKNRMDQHKASSWWFQQVERIRYTVFPGRTYALAMELKAIAEENPRWNIKGRDRSLWTADDYRDHHFALNVTGASEKRLNKLRVEALRRYNLELGEESA